MLFLQTLILVAGYSRILFLDNLETEDIINKDVCDSIGGLGTFDQITDLKDRLPQCALENGEKHVRKRQISSYFMSENDIRQFLELTCTGLNTIDRCYNPVISASKKCLKKTEIRDLETFEQIDQKLVSYICKNQDKVKGYFRELDDRCSNKGISKLFDNCLNIKDRTEINIHDITKLTCRDYEQSENCLITTLSQYCSEDVTDVIMSVIKVLKSNTCNTSPKVLQRSRRSLHSVVRQLAATDKINDIEENVITICAKNGYTSQELKDTLKNVKKCFNEKPLLLVPKHEYIRHVDHCTKDALTVFKSCLPEQYKYLPLLMMDMIHSMINFLYHDVSIIHSELKPCLPMLYSEESTKEFTGCVKKVTDNVKGELIDSKGKFCESYIHMNECFITQVEKHCKPSPGLTQFKNDFMNDVKRPCEAT